jgi:hypothetical protein
MTMTSRNIVTYLVGNGIATVFPYSCKITSANDLLVYLEDTLTGFTTLKTLATDYSVSGVGSDTGGNVTMVAPPVVGTNVLIVRSTPRTQNTNYVEGDKFPASSHEAALDKLTAIVQEIDARLDRCLQIPLMDSTAGTIKKAALRANTVLSFDENGVLSTDTVDSSVMNEILANIIAIQACYSAIAAINSASDNATAAAASASAAYTSALAAAATAGASAYNASTAYTPGQCVVYNGDTWRNLVGCTGAQPVEGTNWHKLTAPSFASISETKARSITDKTVNPADLADFVSRDNTSVFTKPQRITSVALTPGTTVNIDLSLSSVFTLALNSSQTANIAAPTNRPNSGDFQPITIKITGNTSGVVTWDAYWDWGSAGAPTITATSGKVDEVVAMCGNTSANMGLSGQVY